MTTHPLSLSRDQILDYRRTVGALDERLAAGAASLRTAAWVGLQDSMPRAAVLSIHARMTGTEPATWEDPELIQVWGPRYSAYVVAAADRAVFTLGRLPDDGAALKRAVGTADRLEAFLAGRRMTSGEAGRGLGIHPTALRYAAPTGRVVMRWDGARQPTVWMAPRPDVEPRDARLELARRFLHVFGPATAESFARWAGIKPPAALEAFDGLAGELSPVRTPLGDAWILTVDEPAIRSARPRPVDAARLLPSGDAYILQQGRDRDLLVEDPAMRGQLWTPRVWPGGVLVGGELVGTWRRADAVVTVQPWRKLTRSEHDLIEAEAATIPLAAASGIRISWVG